MSISLLSQDSATAVPREQAEGLPDAVLAYLQTTKGVRKLILELFATIADWITLFHPHDKLSALSAKAAHAKNWASLAHVPDDLLKMAEQARVVYENKSWGSLGNFANRVASFFVTITDIFGTLHNQRVCTLSKTALRAVGVVGGVALGVNGLSDLKESAEKIQDVQTAPADLVGKVRDLNDIQVAQAAFSGIGAISDIAFAALTLLTYATTVVVAPWIFLALSTQALICTLGGHFRPHFHVSIKL